MTPVLAQMSRNSMSPRSRSHDRRIYRIRIHRSTHLTQCSNMINVHTQLHLYLYFLVAFIFAAPITSDATPH
jgi:hypothetical protein